ncbi:hypothetical protein TTHERM_00813060 (macronuclear) [Tetrahymena thermophila SB210]|uniref:Uncharacterized protein n=1 Tax=Tetrahymena thermophila (strain SB210) TaxID=312017 RepID=Q22SS5_TETTS|nr:hypothetical protein TTHERM_00813060 [Tetrahymena thermophila SB210]EAR88389.2 hypothetical protein TTHERM_00813060 [Tetrahymena thermophila SB210]|eukprot:XP_001008634.2 hypothetical protein TTHERM_00813060 [Tetrahymena thermophila SB210]
MSTLILASMKFILSFKTNQNKIKLLYFVLQYQQDEQLPKKKFVIQYVGNLDNTFKAIIKKESLSQVIKNIIQEEQGNFEEITKNILDRTQLDEFAIFSFQPGKDSAVLHLEGTNLTKSIQFNIQKINQKELFQEKLQEKNALIQQLKQLNIKVLDHFQEFSTCEGDFFVEYVDLSQRNGLFPLIQSKNQFFEEVNKQYSSLGIISGFVNQSK